MTRRPQLQRDRGNPRLKFLDRYVGIPLVLALGLRRRMRGARTVPADWKSIGLFVTAGIGDAVLLTGVLHDLRAARPDARIVLFVTANNASFARLVDGPDEVVELPVRQVWSAVARVRREHCDVLVDFGAWRRFDAVLTALSDAPVTIGLRTAGQHRHSAFDIVVDHHRDHEIDNDRRLIGVLGIESTSLPTIPVDPAAPPPLDVPYAVLHLWPGGANYEERSWPEDRWFELARELGERGLEIVLTGGPEDRDATAELAATWSAAGVGTRSIAGTSWAETLVWLHDARGVVSVNTGVMHVAAALGAPTVALNGPTSGRRWGPVGVHTRCVASPLVPDGYLNLGFEHDERYRDAMLGITVAMVLDAWDDISADAGVPRTTRAEREPIDTLRSRDISS
jgi:lipopolysaccharide heptosyltransferase III